MAPIRNASAVAATAGTSLALGDAATTAMVGARGAQSLAATEGLSDAGFGLTRMILQAQCFVADTEVLLEESENSRALASMNSTQASPQGWSSRSLAIGMSMIAIGVVGGYLKIERDRRQFRRVAKELLDAVEPIVFPLA